MRESCGIAFLGAGDEAPMVSLVAAAVARNRSGRFRAYTALALLATTGQIRISGAFLRCDDRQVFGPWQLSLCRLLDAAVDLRGGKGQLLVATVELQARPFCKSHLDALCGLCLRHRGGAICGSDDVRNQVVHRLEIRRALCRKVVSKCRCLCVIIIVLLRLSCSEP